MEEENPQEEEVHDEPDEDYDIARPPEMGFIATVEGQQYLRGFATQSHRVSFSIIELCVGVNSVLWIEASIRDIHNYITERVPGRTLIDVSICNDRFSHGTEELISGLSRTFADLLNLISSISQSNEILDIAEALALQMYYI